MSDREQQLIEAAMRYLALFEHETLPNIDEFVATVDPQLRAELKSYLEAILASGFPIEPIVLSPEEQTRSARAKARARERFSARMQALSPMQTLSEVRLAQRLSLGALARHLNLPVPLLDRLERGGVQLATIPNRLITRLAEILGQAEADIQAMLAAAQSAAGSRLADGRAVYLSAKDGTTVQPESQVSFAEALQASAPTPEQLAEWGEPPHS